MPTPAPVPALPTEEFAERRRLLLESLEGAAGVVFAGPGSEPLLGRWRPDPDFRYLTGIDNEPDAAILFDPSHDDPSRRCILFLKPLDPEAEAWDGYREPVGEALKGRTGFTRIMRTGALPRFLTEAARRAGRVACLHRLSSYNAPVSPDLQIFRKLNERIPGLAIEDRSLLLPLLRSVKSPAEVERIERAIAATSNGLAALQRTLVPGVGETDLQRALEGGFVEAGAEGIAFNSIVGAGANATVLHYKRNDGPVNDGDLVLVDSGASYGGYAADITRVYPANGRFTPEQRRIYEIVLKAQEAAIAAAQPGVTLLELDAIARAVIDEAGYADRFIHGLGHHLGTEVHDANPEGTLKPGMVLTIEPGIYLREQAIGVRIEDDILITESGARNLSESIPKSPDDVERSLAEARR